MTASATTLGYCGVMSVFYNSPGGRQALYLVVVLIITKVKPKCAIKSTSSIGEHSIVIYDNSIYHNLIHVSIRAHTPVFM